ncbi:unnamed protein product [Onchocerca ochengi]|uniref:Uncharacterized protein n=1 Tax=Onchocerca ochengi TaxID=42157 RepID=A0A182EIA8_ONCOC|nr:unnamed protein product [Onchocerca ochengi]
MQRYMNKSSVVQAHRDDKPDCPISLCSRVDFAPYNTFRAILNPALCSSLEHCSLQCKDRLLHDLNGFFQCICARVQNVISKSYRELSDVNYDK